MLLIQGHNHLWMLNSFITMNCASLFFERTHKEGKKIIRKCSFIKVLERTGDMKSAYMPLVKA